MSASAPLVIAEMVRAVRVGNLGATASGCLPLCSSVSTCCVQEPGTRRPSLTAKLFVSKRERGRKQTIDILHKTMSSPRSLFARMTRTMWIVEDLRKKTRSETRKDGKKVVNMLFQEYKSINNIPADTKTWHHYVLLVSNTTTVVAHVSIVSTLHANRMALPKPTVLSYACVTKTYRCVQQHV